MLKVHAIRAIIAALGAFCVCSVVGCGGASGLAEAPDRGLTPPRTTSGGPTTPERPVALVDGEPVYWSTLRPMLAESGGGALLQEIALDRRLAAALAAEGLEVTPDLIERERTEMQRALSGAATRRDAAGPGAESSNSAGDDGVAPDPRLLDEVARARGLGPQRMAALVARSAGLRLLVRSRVVVDEAMLRRAHDLAWGPRSVVRVIVGPAGELSNLRAELAAVAGDEARTRAFAAAARRISSDPSRVRGGAIEPFHAEDPAYPLALRRAVAQLRPGEISPLVALERGLALVLLEGVEPATGPSYDEARVQLEPAVRARQERLLMDELAAQMLGEARVSVLDASLDWSWRGVERPGR